MRKLPLAIIAAALTTVTVLAACNGGGGETAAQYTYGPMSQTGVLVGTGVSLVRRGTHALYADGKAAFLLESKTLNLQEFAGKRVFVTGDLQRNVHEKYLPVLAVTSVVVAEHEETMKEWKLPALNLTFSAPESWQATAAERSISFIAADGGSGTVFTLDAIDASGLPEGIPAVVAGNVAVKMRNAPPGGEEVHILRGGQVIRVKFSPIALELSAQRLQYAAVMGSMTFASSSSSSSAGTGSGTSTGVQPCGGPAGILCPAGQYCDVFDPQQNIGKCRSR